MLHSQYFQNVRLWPRGVDLSQFGPSKRSFRLRASWGVGEAPRSKAHPQTIKHPVDIGMHWQGRKASMPMTPPMTPEVYAQVNHTVETVEEPQSIDHGLPERVVLLYVGRV